MMLVVLLTTLVIPQYNMSTMHGASSFQPLAHLLQHWAMTIPSAIVDITMIPKLDCTYLQSCYYDPDTGRFINADDVAFIGASGTAISCNMFAYCENNTVNAVDLDGSLKLGKIIDRINSHFG